MAYKYEIMSWWSMITTNGRLLQDVCVDFTKGKDELRIIGLTLEDGDDIAILIDHSRNQARLYAPFGDCTRLAAQHYYELFIRSRKPQETFTDHVERFLSITLPDEEKPSPPEDGELGIEFK